MNAGTATFDRTIAQLNPALTLPWRGQPGLTARPETGTARPAATLAGTSLARLWLDELHHGGRWRRVGERLGFGLLAAGGLIGLAQLGLHSLDFAARWSVFTRLVASVLS